MRGSPTSNAESASRGSVIISIGPSQTALTERGSPIATNGGRLNAERLSQHLARTSGPMPAGSPSEIASGVSGRPATAAALIRKSRLAEFDHRIAAKVAQIAASAQVYPLLVELVVHLVEGGIAGLAFVAAA